jgi:hypothetical protein
VHPFPLAHGASGIFDEIILGAEGLLLFILIIAFFRSRGRKPQPAAGDRVPEKSAPAEENK